MLKLKFFIVMMFLVTTQASSQQTVFHHVHCEVSFNTEGTIMYVKGKAVLLLDESGVIRRANGEIVSRPDDNWSLAYEIADQVLKEMNLPSQGELRAYPNLCWKSS